MGWDSSRPVPWRRFVKEYAIYAGIMAVVLVAINRGRDTVPVLIALLFAGPIYIGFAAALAKLGYQRKTLAELRTPRATSSTDAAVSTAVTRERPAPTKRTSAGRNQPQRTTRRKR